MINLVVRGLLSRLINYVNYKCKSHRGWSPKNRTDALRIVEIRNVIERAYACGIPNNKMVNIVPIIKKVVAAGSIIWTDEHSSYSRLNGAFQHSTVCHKYEFINNTTGTNTQAVESFNNCIKYEIKKTKRC
ncbi:hypothetical protein DMUE_3196 [Dictyocoela muelleri]|nr:hypothetical protein DMUE_3196 [Dictyocoela muelleri]